MKGSHYLTEMLLFLKQGSRSTSFQPRLIVTAVTTPLCFTVAWLIHHVPSMTIGKFDHLCNRFGNRHGLDAPGHHSRPMTLLWGELMS